VLLNYCSNTDQSSEGDYERDHKREERRRDADTKQFATEFLEILCRDNVRKTAESVRKITCDFSPNILNYRYKITVHITLLNKYFFNELHDIIKGKAGPLQAWTGPEGSRKLRFPDFVTTAQGWW